MGMKMEKLYAPWTSDQVDALNRFQRAGFVHPFTCTDAHEGHDRSLIATCRGWICPHCPYTQNWAWEGMLQEPVNPVAGLLAPAWAGELLAWMREPDCVEVADLGWLTDWVNRRPLAAGYALAAVPAPSPKTVTINGHTREIQQPELSDLEVAGRVRMLLRSDLDHEAVCTLARDRIVFLSAEVDRLIRYGVDVAQVFAAQNHALQIVAEQLRTEAAHANAASVLISLSPRIGEEEIARALSAHAGEDPDGRQSFAAQFAHASRVGQPPLTHSETVTAAPNWHFHRVAARAVLALLSPPAGAPDGKEYP